MTSHRILITRPVHDAEILARELEAAGFRTLIEPLTTPDLFPGARESLARHFASPLQAALLTSRHALGSLSDAPRDLPIYAVGDKTAESARIAGFQKVNAAEGTAESLIALVKQACDPAAAPLLYPRGQHIAADIEGSLAACGFHVISVPVYEAVAHTALSDGLMHALKSQSIAAAAFYSQRHAQIFQDLVARAELQTALAPVAAFAASARIAECLGAMPWGRIESFELYDLPGALRATLK